MGTSKTALRRRWLSSETSVGLLADVELFLAEGTLGRQLDVRGAEVGVDPPLADFRLEGAEHEHLDLSFGKGALCVRRCTVRRLVADEFSFDRATVFSKAHLVECSFARSRGRFEAQDVMFQNCDFSSSTFRGGFNEYGFTRCTFEACLFADIVWRNTFFKACRMIEPSLRHARLESSLLSGLRIEGAPGWEAFLVDCDIRSLLVDGERVQGSGAAG